MDIDKLIVKEAYVGKGIVMKRFHARARGRGARILKPFSHLTIILSEEMEKKNGSKTKPVGFRLGVNRTWDSRWFGTKSYSNFLHQDLKLRKFLFEKLKSAAVSKILIERPAGKTRVSIFAGRPGLVIGKKGQDIETLRKELEKQIGNEVNLNIIEVRKPELDAKLVAETIAQQLERRVAFRRAMKRSVQAALRLGAQGVRINCAGQIRWC